MKWNIDCTVGKEMKWMKYMKVTSEKVKCDVLYKTISNESGLKPVIVVSLEMSGWSHCSAAPSTMWFGSLPVIPYVGDYTDGFMFGH